MMNKFAHHGGEQRGVRRSVAGLVSIASDTTNANIKANKDVCDEHLLVDRTSKCLSHTFALSGTAS